MAFILLSLVGFFTVQPLISSTGMWGEPAAPAGNCCAKMMKCPKKGVPAKDNRSCQGDGCNPFMACAYGNFFTIGETRFTFLYMAPGKGHKLATDDNRLSAGFSESWHPPEVVAHIS